MNSIFYYAKRMQWLFAVGMSANLTYIASGSSNTNTWSDKLAADVFLGLQQGLTWMIFFMLMDMMLDIGH